MYRARRDLAEAKGSQTRAILKLLGRGALLLAAGAFDLTLWVFGALLVLFGFCRRSRRPPNGRPWRGCVIARRGG